MKLFQSLIIALVLAFGHSYANAALPAAPDPAKLSADWWSYFQPGESLDSRALNERISALELTLKKFVKVSGTSLDAEHYELPDQIIKNLNIFADIKHDPLPLAAPDIIPAETYTIDEALQQYNIARNLNQEINAENEELEWLKAISIEERKQQSRRRNQYLSLNKTTPGRAEKGLEVMAARVALELKQLKLERRKKILQRSEIQAKKIQDELEIIPSRLIAPPSVTQTWKQKSALANQELDSSRFTTQIADHSVAQFSLALRDQAKTRYATLLTIKRDIDIAIHELIAMQAQLVITLNSLINKTDSISPDATRGLISDSQALQERLVQQRARLHRAIETFRDAVSVLPENKKATPAELQNLKDKILSETVASDQALRRLAQETDTTKLITNLLKQRQLSSESFMIRTVADIGHRISALWSASSELLTASLFEISEAPVTMLGLIRVLIIFTAALWISKGLRRAIQKIGERRGAINQSSLYTLGRILHYIVLSIGIIIGLSSIGIDFTKFALFASALGVGIGFGLQTLISNFVAGLIILFEKNLKVKDFVELESGVTGEVKEINMRSTLITTNDNIDIVVPNSEFVSGRVTNWTLREAYRRIHIPFGVAYGTEKELVKTAALEAASEVPFTLMDKKSRQPQVWLVEFGDSSLNFELIVWLVPDAVKRPSGVQAAYLWEIETKLKKYGIEIPFPQRDLHLRSVFGLKDEAAHSVLPAKTQL